MVMCDESPSHSLGLVTIVVVLDTCQTLETRMNMHIEDQYHVMKRREKR